VGDARALNVTCVPHGDIIIDTVQQIRQVVEVGVRSKALGLGAAQAVRAFSRRARRREPRHIMVSIT
jgi:hypothetical protein